MGFELGSFELTVDRYDVVTIPLSRLYLLTDYFKMWI